MKTVIMAGGQGKRIQALFPGIPKPLIPIGGKPVLEREIISLREQGFTDIILTISHMANQIQSYFGDGSWLGVQIEYFVEEKPLGNAGALFKLRKKLDSDFLLLNADAVFNVDFNRFIANHKLKGGLITIFTHPNSHPFDSGLVITNADGSVERWLAKEDIRPKYYKNQVNAGLHVINPDALDMCHVNPEEISSLNRIDLDRQILKPLCGSGKIFAYTSPEYVEDMGTPERFKAVSRAYRNGIITAKSLKNKQKAIFLDRDGTINQYKGFLRSIDDFELLPGVAEAIRTINASGYLAIVTTNQPVIARGEVSIEELQRIHNKMETLLGLEGAYLNSLYYCPHHPDKGFDGEIPELKINCNCRKPKPGMLFKASEDYNIDLSQSWMVGDGENDVKAGKAAGCKTALISSSTTNCYDADIVVKSLLEFVERVLK